MKIWKFGNNNGFSLVEIVIAAMLMGMVLLAAFPMIMTGKRNLERKQREMEVRLLGDRVFERVCEELERSGQAVLEAEDTKEIVLEEPEREWQKLLECELEHHGVHMKVETEKLDDEWLFLNVKLTEDEMVFYEREQVVPVLNLGLSYE